MMCLIWVAINAPCLSATLSPALTQPRLPIPDWNNDSANLHLDIDQELRKAPDDKARAAILRRLKRALAGDQPPPSDPGNKRRMPPRFGPSRRGQRSFDAD